MVACLVVLIAYRCIKKQFNRAIPYCAFTRHRCLLLSTVYSFALVRETQGESCILQIRAVACEYLSEARGLTIPRPLRTDYLILAKHIEYSILAEYDPPRDRKQMPRSVIIDRLDDLQDHATKLLARIKQCAPTTRSSTHVSNSMLLKETTSTKALKNKVDKATQFEENVYNEDPLVDQGIDPSIFLTYRDSIQEVPTQDACSVEKQLVSSNLVDNIQEFNDSEVTNCGRINTIPKSAFADDKPTDVATKASKEHVTCSKAILQNCATNQGDPIVEHQCLQGDDDSNTAMTLNVCKNSQSIGGTVSKAVGYDMVTEQSKVSRPFFEKMVAICLADEKNNAKSKKQNKIDDYDSSLVNNKAIGHQTANMINKTLGIESDSAEGYKKGYSMPKEEDVFSVSNSGELKFNFSRIEDESILASSEMHEAALSQQPSENNTDDINSGIDATELRIQPEMDVQWRTEVPVANATTLKLNIEHPLLFISSNTLLYRRNTDSESEGNPCDGVKELFIGENRLVGTNATNIEDETIFLDDKIVELKHNLLDIKKGGTAECKKTQKCQHSLEFMELWSKVKHLELFASDIAEELEHCKESTVTILQGTKEFMLQLIGSNKLSLPNK